MPEANGAKAKVDDEKAKSDQKPAQEKNGVKKNAQQPEKKGGLFSFARAKKDAKEAEDEAEKELDEDAESDEEDDAEGGEEGEEGNQGGGAKKNGGLFGFSGIPGVSEREKPKSADHRMRKWDFCFEMRGWANYSTDNLNVFFSVRLDHTGENSRRTILLPRYTGVTSCKPQGTVSLDKPEILFAHKRLTMRYLDLERYKVKIDMWKMSSITFNTYAGVQELACGEIAQKDSNISTIIRKKFKDENKKQKKKKTKVDIASFDCTCILEEILHFRMTVDHWAIDTTKITKATPDDKAEQQIKRAYYHLKQKCEQHKRLQFIFPCDKRSNPGAARFVAGNKVKTLTTDWNKDKNSPFWPDVGKADFRGTRSELKNKFFIVTVMTGDPMFLETEQAANLQKGSLFGKCMFSLMGVIDNAVFKGQIKQKQADEKFPYVIGTVDGNVKCEHRALGMDFTEKDVEGPETKKYSIGQPMSAGTVTHLSPSELYLVVKVRKCENLPIADAEKSTSDPYLRIVWDNMVTKSPIIKEELRPIFNFCAHFPVRSVFMKAVKNPKVAAQDLLRRDMKSKGSLVIQVWDWDLTANDFLGSVDIPLDQLVQSKQKDKRDLRGKPTAGDDAEDKKDDEPGEKKSLLPSWLQSSGIGGQWYEKVVDTRIYDAMRNGAALRDGPPGATGTSSIFFEVYFYPDMAWLTDLPEGEKESDQQSSLWADRRAALERSNEDLRKKYAVKFPDSIGAFPQKPSGTGIEMCRQFHCSVERQTASTTGSGAAKSVMPLVAIMTPIIVPEDLTYPIQLLQWSSCLPFQKTSARQSKTGLIPPETWNDATFVLMKQCGAQQDHAVCLAAMLLGCKYDAYVCKGTIKGTLPIREGRTEVKEALIEHTWVMTRYEGWVSFWEPCTRQIFHLPKRYKVKRKKDVVEQNSKKKPVVVVEDNPVEEDNQDQNQLAVQWEGEGKDALVTFDDLDALPSVAFRAPRAKSKVKDKKGQNVLANTSATNGEVTETFGKAQLKERLNFVAAPRADLLTKDDTLVNWLPYDSIETVFNDKNVWANHQHHHPSCIKYDLPNVQDDDEELKEPYLWQPMLQKNDIDKVKFTASEFPLPPPLKNHALDEVQKRVVDELEENLKLARAKRGFDALIETNAEINKRIQDFLEMQEAMWFLDPDFQPRFQYEIDKNERPWMAKMEGNGLELWSLDAQAYFENNMRRCLNNCNQYGSPWSPPSPEKESAGWENYTKDQKKKWNKMLDMVEAWLAQKSTFPVRRGKKFMGFPVHFSTSEEATVRGYLMEMELYKAYVDMPLESVWYTVQVMMKPLQGAIQSTWVYVGIQLPNDKDNEDRCKDLEKLGGMDPTES